MHQCAAPRKHSPWKHHLDGVVNQLHAGGIINKWLNDEFNPAIFLDVPEEVRETPLEFINVAFAVCVLASGLGLAGLVFTGEQIVHMGDHGEQPAI